MVNTSKLKQKNIVKDGNLNYLNKFSWNPVLNIINISFLLVLFILFWGALSLPVNGDDLLAISYLNKDNPLRAIWLGVTTETGTYSSAAYLPIFLFKYFELLNNHKEIYLVQKLINFTYLLVGAFFVIISHKKFQVSSEKKIDHLLKFFFILTCPVFYVSLNQNTPYASHFMFSAFILFLISRQNFIQNRHIFLTSLLITISGWYFAFHSIFILGGYYIGLLINNNKFKRSIFIIAISIALYFIFFKIAPGFNSFSANKGLNYSVGINEVFIFKSDLSNLFYDSLPELLLFPLSGIFEQWSGNFLWFIFSCLLLSLFLIYSPTKISLILVTPLLLLISFYFTSKIALGSSRHMAIFMPVVFWIWFSVFERCRIFFRLFLILIILTNIFSVFRYLEQTKGTSYLELSDHICYMAKKHNAKLLVTYDMSGISKMFNDLRCDDDHVVIGVDYNIAGDFPDLRRGAINKISNYNNIIVLEKELDFDLFIKELHLNRVDYSIIDHKILGANSGRDMEYSRRYSNSPASISLNILNLSF